MARSLVDFGLTPRQGTTRAQNVKNGIIKPKPKMLPESKDHQHVSLTFEIPSICSPTEMETPIVTSLFRNWAQVLILKKNPNKFRG